MLLVVFLAACGSNDTPTAPTSNDPSVGLNVPFGTTDLVVGTGAEAITGRSVTVQYTGWLYYPNAAENKGTQIDSNTVGYGPFVLGSANIIQGWHQGIPGMRVGGRRRIVIPPALAYGVAGRLPQVPGNSTLLFEITLISVQ
jgi:FKBP-type peptidyl-prolyl cis-trans isomerase FkpA